MVVALREQAPKKSRLSLFRLGKPKRPIPADDATPRSYVDVSSNDIVAASTRTSPRQPPSQGQAPPVIPVHYQYPSSSNLPGSYDWSRHDEQQHRRARADSLPLQSPAEHGPVATRGQESKHSRQRSHFSIPDVIVTTCDDEGEQEVVQLHIPPNKRRSYVLRDPHDLDPASPRSSKKSAATAHRPEPLIRFDPHEVSHMVRSGSVPSLANAPHAVSTAASSPTSSPSSSLSKASSKRTTRRPSFPSLFGRKSLDSSRIDAEPLPPTPASAPAVPTIAWQVKREAPFTPDDCRAANASALSKKELKARQKHELALIKQREHVDRLVRQHDSKTRKAQEKHDAKLRKRQHKIALANALAPNPDPAPVSAPASVGAQRKTVFQAAVSAPPLARRTSVRGFVGERRGSEPTLPAQHAVQTRNAPFSVDLPSTARTPFAQPRPAPRPAPRAPLGISPAGHSVSPPRPVRPAPPIPAPVVVQEEQEEQEEQEGERAARLARRTSVQRVLVLAEVDAGRLHKRASLRQRASAHALKRRSSHMDGVEAVYTQGGSSKRTSGASERRVSLLPRVAADAGWQVVQPDDEARADDSTVAQPDTDDARWHDWVEDEATLARKHGALVQQEMAVDRVLADLRAAQHHQLHRTHHESTPTHQLHNPPDTHPETPVRPHSTMPSKHESLASSDETELDSDADDDEHDDERTPPLCFSRPFSPQHQQQLELESAPLHKPFRIDIPLPQLQPLDLFNSP